MIVIKNLHHQINSFNGGIFIFLGILYSYDINFYIFYFLIFNFNIRFFSDLKLIKSAILRLIMQISLVILFVSITDLKIQDTRIFYWMNYLKICFLIVCLYLLYLNFNQWIKFYRWIEYFKYWLLLIDKLSDILSKISRFRNLP